MNRILRTMVLALLGSTQFLCAITVPYLNYRSQGFNAARELVGWQSFINIPCEDDYYGAFSVLAEYGTSFDHQKITKALFGDTLLCNENEKCLSMAIQGTKVVDRLDKALMAENFYLPTDFNAMVTFKPRIKNFIVDFNLYLGLDHICQGLYFRVHAPFCHTQWDMHMCEDVISSGTYNYDPGYFNDTYTPEDDANDPTVYGLANDALLHSFSDYIMRQGAITGVEGITYNPLENARIHEGKLSKNAVAELTAALGWNFFNCTDYTLGANVRAAAPTGTRPTGTWLFEPMVGQGKHWEAGVGLNARWACWRSCNEDHAIALYGDLNATHLFKTEQCRTFDLCVSPLSRYMLAMKFTDQPKNLGGLVPGAANPQVPTYQFAKEFVPVANISTIPVYSTIGIQAELALKLAYTYCNWQFDVGYDFWCHSQEDICTRCAPCSAGGFKNNMYGLKGDAFTFGFASQPSAMAIQGTPLSATESQATIFKGTNGWGHTTAVPGGTYTWNQNPGIDNPLQAQQPGTTPLFLETHEIGDNPAGGAAQWRIVNTSINPQLLNEADLDINSARVAGMSNKVFGHIGYIWNNCRCYTPYLGVGGEAEFGVNDCKKCGTQCSDELENSYYSTVSLSQWGVWIKGGVAFN